MIGGIRFRGVDYVNNNETRPRQTVAALAYLDVRGNSKRVLNSDSTIT